VPQLFGLRGTVPPLFRRKVEEFAVTWGDLQRLNYNKTNFGRGSVPRTPLAQLITLSQTPELMRSVTSSLLSPPPFRLGTQGRLVLLLNWYPHFLDPKLRHCLSLTMQCLNCQKNQWGQWRKRTGASGETKRTRWWWWARSASQGSAIFVIWWGWAGSLGFNLRRNLLRVHEVTVPHFLDWGTVSPLFRMKTWRICCHNAVNRCDLRRLNYSKTVFGSPDPFCEISGHSSRLRIRREWLSPHISSLDPRSPRSLSELVPPLFRSNLRPWVQPTTHHHDNSTTKPHYNNDNN